MQASAWPADPIAAVTHPDPYPWYARLAAGAPFAFDARLKLWVAAAPDAVREVLAHPDCRVRPVHEPVPAALDGPAGELFGALVRMNEGERHAAPKAALMRALAALAPERVRRAADAVALPLAHAVDDADTLNAFVRAVPVRTVASLLGFPAGRLADVEAWTATYVAGLSPLASPADVAAAHGAAQSLLEAMRELTASAPASALLAAVLDAPWRDEHTLLANLAGLMTQTYEASAGLLGNCVTALLRDPAAERDTLARRVMTGDPAIHNTRRYAACDLEIRGARVRAGEGMLLVLATSEGFGAGRHLCPGQALALAIVTRALHALPLTLPALRWRYRASVNARMPVFIEQEET